VKSANNTVLIGVISDTHGLLRAEALDGLRGSDQIIHAGDVGDPSILASLSKIAPVTAVRGNIDTASWAQSLPQGATLKIGEIRIYVIHDLKELDLDAAGTGVAAIVSGHSHVPRKEVKGGVLYFNPGSAGPRRFKLPISIGRMIVRGATLEAELVELAK
jgi:putative phosphoesterase